MKGGDAINRHLYGYHLAKYHLYCVITEAEIDALSLWEIGVPSVAIGGSSLTKIQYDLLLKAGFSYIIVATDNDIVGERAYIQIHKALSEHVPVSQFNLSGVKDVNELLMKDKGELITRAFDKKLYQKPLFDIK
jgi:DNA primase